MSHRSLPSVWRRSSVGLLLLLMLLVLTGGLQAQEPAGAGEAERSALRQAKALESTVTRVIARTEKSVVCVVRTTTPPGGNAQAALRPQVRAAPAAPFSALRSRQLAPQPTAVGAGVVIDNGLILTQYLLVDQGESHAVYDSKGIEYAAEIRAADPRSGLAVLSLSNSAPAPRDLPALTIGKAEELRKGNFVIAIGNPFAIKSDGQPTASWGVVSNTARKAPADENLNNVNDNEGAFRTTLHHFGTLIQTDARLGWNASGGALVTLSGQLVGVTTTSSAITGHERPAGYAIPLNETMRRVVGDLKEGREPEYGLMGIAFNPVVTESASTGARGVGVNGVFQGSPSQQAGLVRNDLITRIANEPIIDSDSLQLIVNSRPPGAEVPVEFERAGSQLSTVVKLGKAFIQGEKVITNLPPAWRGIRVDYSTAAPSTVLQQKAQQGHIDPEGCVMVSDVELGSVSWRSGVRPYSFISHVGGERVTTPREFYDAVRDADQSVSVRFTKPLASAKPAQPEAANPQ